MENPILLLFLLIIFGFDNRLNGNKLTFQISENFIKLTNKMDWLFFDNDDRLISKSYSDEDISILVGENGSGKSTYLNQLAKLHLNSGRNVIAIANTVYDKFNINRVNFNHLRISQGKSLSKNVIKKIVKILEYTNSKGIFNLINAFDYVGFDSKITIEIKGLSTNYQELIKNSSFNRVSEGKNGLTVGIIYFLMGGNCIFCPIGTCLKLNNLLFLATSM